MKVGADSSKEMSWRLWSLRFLRKLKRVWYASSSRQVELRHVGPQSVSLACLSSAVN